MTIHALLTWALTEELYLSIKTHPDKPQIVTLILKAPGRSLEASGSLDKILEQASLWVSQS